MSTRGLWGFHKDGEDKLNYNHYDSYPSSLGEKIQEFLANHTFSELNKLFNEIRLVDRGKEDIDEVIRDITDLDKSGEKLMVDGKSFIQDSLFCEWAYIVNLTTNELEIYVGLQNSPQDNRYRIDKPTNFAKDINQYYSCKLLLRVPLKKIKNFNIEKVNELCSDIECEKCHNRLKCLTKGEE